MSLVSGQGHPPSQDGGIFNRLEHALFGNYFDDKSHHGVTTKLVANDADKFAVSLDVSHFKPEELKVNLDGHSLIVEGKHEQQDENNYIERSFIRKWTLPKSADLASLKSNISKEGRLSIEAHKVKKAPEALVRIPIERL